MPAGRIVIEAPIHESFRVAQVRGMFDVADRQCITHEWDVNIRCESFDWNVGLIVGPSGSGKSVIAGKLWPAAYVHTGFHWPKGKAVVDCFPETLAAKEVTALLSSVGFSSPPHWLKCYQHLSNGQKFRCELARLLAEDAELCIFDEFTSVVDRDAAKISSLAVAKILRKRGRPKLIAVSCHYDIIDWLDPDWIYDVATANFARRSLRRRPQILLEVFATTRAAWPLFRGHHYLSRDLHQGARCFVALWNDIPVAFTSYIHCAGIVGLKREHRTVVLPDYQGAGIGNRLSEWLGAHVKANGLRFSSTTSHPAMIRHRLASPNWRLKSIGHQAPHRGKNCPHIRRTGSFSRRTASFEYIGEPGCVSARSSPGRAADCSHG